MSKLKIKHESSEVTTSATLLNSEMFSHSICVEIESLERIGSLPVVISMKMKRTFSLYKCLVLSENYYVCN